VSCDIGDPVAQRLVHRVLQRARAGLHRPHLGAQHFHAEDVGLLPLDVDRAHIDDAGQAEARADVAVATPCWPAPVSAMMRSCPCAAPAGSGPAVVDLVRAGVVELLALEIDLGAAEMLGQPLGEIERARPADIVLQIAVQLGLERRIGLGRGVGLFQRSRISGISVSATKRPPKMPKWPRSSGLRAKHLSRMPEAHASQTR
jgi:hypothetical protein